ILKKKPKESLMFRIDGPVVVAGVAPRPAHPLEGALQMQQATLNATLNAQYGDTTLKQVASAFLCLSMIALITVNSLVLTGKLQAVTVGWINVGLAAGSIVAAILRFKDEPDKKVYLIATLIMFAAFIAVGAVGALGIIPGAKMAWTFLGTYIG